MYSLSKTLEQLLIILATFLCLPFSPLWIFLPFATPEPFTHQEPPNVLPLLAALGNFPL